jgi:spermidine synthase
VLMGSLPLALHPAPERVLFVGLATGMTASAVLGDARVKDVQIVELIREMEPLARSFAAYNGRLLDDPRVHLVVDDGRSYVPHAETFDVVVADLFVPWHSHAGYLYTVEHYREVRAQLRPHTGLFVQWLPLWQLGPRELALIENSFALVFPGASRVLYDQNPERALLALVSRPSREHETHAPEGVRFLGGLGADSRTGLNTDDHPVLEFSAPRSERRGEFLVGSRLYRHLKLAKP